jgi:D-glycero-D-manno-heptose 1,7-bisphosphate phosphatase
MRRCVFLDRDGVINFAPAQGEYICTWAEFRLIPSIVDWIRLFNSLDLLVIVVTNQRGVALGRIDPMELARIHDEMRQELLGLGARIDDIFCCVHDEQTCNCRKPRPGMVIEAARKWDIDLTQSTLIGDSSRDEELALACGMAFVAVHEGNVIGRIAAEVYKATGRIPASRSWSPPHTSSALETVATVSPPIWPWARISRTE